MRKFSYSTNFGFRVLAVLYDFAMMVTYAVDVYGIMYYSVCTITVRKEFISDLENMIPLKYVINMARMLYNSLLSSEVFSVALRAALSCSEKSSEQKL